MPVVLRGFPVLIIIASVFGIIYYFTAYRKIGKPKRDYYLLPYNLVKDGLSNIIKERSTMFFMVLLYLVYCCSIFYTSDLEEGFGKLILKSCYLYFPLIFSLTKWDKVKLLRVIDFFIYGCVAQVILSFIDAFIDAGFSFKIQEFSYVYLSYNLHPAYAAFLVVLGIIFSSVRLIFVLKEVGWGRSVLKFASIISLLSLFTILLSSKAGLISLGVSFCFLFVYAGYVLRSWRLLIPLVSFVFLFISIAYFNLGDRASSKMKELIDTSKTKVTESVKRDKAKSVGSTKSRLILWENSFETIKKSPIIGFGIGDGKNELHQTLVAENEVFLDEKGYNSHNQFLEVGLSLGLLGVILLLTILVLSLFGFGKFSLMSTLFVLIVFINFGTESFMEKQSGSIVVCWLLCFLNSGRGIFKSVFSFKK